MTALNAPETQAEIAAAELLVKHPIVTFAGEEERLRLLLALAWLHGWTAAGREAQRIIAAKRAELS